MCLDHGLTNDSGSKECPEGYKKVATSYARQVKERIGNLKFKKGRQFSKEEICMPFSNEIFKIIQS